MHFKLYTHNRNINTQTHCVQHFILQTFLLSTNEFIVATYIRVKSCFKLDLDVLPTNLCKIYIKWEQEIVCL